MPSVAGSLFYLIQAVILSFHYLNMNCHQIQHIKNKYSRFARKIKPLQEDCFQAVHGLFQTMQPFSEKDMISGKYFCS